MASRARAASTTIAAAAIVGLVLRLAFALLYWIDKPLTHDEREYLALAASVAAGDGFALRRRSVETGTAQQFGRAPGISAVPRCDRRPPPRADDVRRRG